MFLCPSFVFVISQEHLRSLLVFFVPSLGNKSLVDSLLPADSSPSFPLSRLSTESSSQSVGPAGSPTSCLILSSTYAVLCPWVSHQRTTHNLTMVHTALSALGTHDPQRCCFPRKLITKLSDPLKALQWPVPSPIAQLAALLPMYQRSRHSLFVSLKKNLV